MPFIPQIADWVFKDTLGVPLTVVRFDSKEDLIDFPDGIDHMSVEPTLESSGDITIPIQAWRDGVINIRAFVTRAFGLPESEWPLDIDDDLEIKFDPDPTKSVKVEALKSAPNPFDRETFYLLVGGLPHVTLKAWDASDPMRLRTWRIYHNAVESLIAINQGGVISLGL